MLAYNPSLRMNEANVQAALYMALRAAGVNCVLEYAVDGARFDIAVVCGHIIPIVIEVKYVINVGLFMRKWASNRQHIRYLGYGVEVFVCPDFGAIPGVVTEVVAAIGRLRAAGVIQN